MKLHKGKCKALYPGKCLLGRPRFGKLSEFIAKLSLPFEKGTIRIIRETRLVEYLHECIAFEKRGLSSGRGTCSYQFLASE
ncbi:hypothetical protein DUI87_11848 [Hirundo rustica rustica]|uniref:Uncharacterized protein n=1 Tax=Hirundo rustica rustica TaxID=333673 RepID=A0A3M0KFA0_HIRRU|nr:hypothetical protein DUI87_11848 [Hirundo rustica rustica]